MERKRRPGGEVYLCPDYIDAVVEQERDLNADSDFGDTNEVVYYHSNPLYNVYALTDADGNVVERYRYDAYGGCTVLDDDWSVDLDGISDVQNPYLFTGRRLDLESGLMQYRNRYYSLPLGRFISRDPVGYSVGPAFYVYVGDRPVGAADPTGMWTRIERSNGVRARTCAERDDQFETGMSVLAFAAGMDRESAFSTSDQQGWLQTANGGQVTSEKDIIPGQWYTVPNTVFLNYALPDSLSYGEWALWWFDEMTRLFTEGFWVNNNPAVTDNRFVEEFMDTDLYGVVFIGHGREANDTNLGALVMYDPTLKEDVFVTPQDVLLRGGPIWRLGCLKIVACYGGVQGWSPLVADHGYYWATQKYVYWFYVFIVPHGCHP